MICLPLRLDFLGDLVFVYADRADLDAALARQLRLDADTCRAMSYECDLADCPGPGEARARWTDRALAVLAGSNQTSALPDKCGGFVPDPDPADAPCADCPGDSPDCQRGENWIAASHMGVGR